MTDSVTVLARAKVNLCLHVTGRRPDGYHLLDSLVVFPRLGDLIEAERATQTSLTLAGPFGQDLGSDADNLVLRAARLMPGAAALRLEKNLPVASGIGGGSADAAAALRAMAELSGAALPDTTALLGLGADVPVCLTQQPARMRGIGDRLDPLPKLPALWCVLANPRVACPTPPVFQALARVDNPPLPDLPARLDAPEDLIRYLETTRNDLQAPAREICPAIAAVLAALEATENCQLHRMSGSGATCFGLYKTEADALIAADQLRADQPSWWVAAAPLD